MRQRLLDVLVGLAVGVLVGGGYVSSRWQRTFASTYLVQTADQAHVASEIAAGRAAELAAKIRAALPAYVEALDRELADAEGRCWALWAVRDAFAAAGEEPPAAIAPTLAGLPDRGSCPPPGGAPAGEPGRETQLSAVGGVAAPAGKWTTRCGNGISMPSASKRRFSRL